jgi:hypothetical protein
LFLANSLQAPKAVHSIAFMELNLATWIEVSLETDFSPVESAA